MALLFLANNYDFFLQGVVCLDILKEQWSPAFSIKNILLSISCLLQECNPGRYILYIYVVCACVYVCIYTCMYAYVYICMCVCIMNHNSGS